MHAASEPACGRGDDRASRASWFRSRSFRPAPTTRPFYAQIPAAGVNGAVRHVIRKIASIEARDPFRERTTGKQTPRPDERERGVPFAARVSAYAGACLAYWPKYTESRPSCLTAIARPARTPAAACAP